MLQNLWLLLTSLIHSSCDELIQIKAELETAKVPNLADFQTVVQKLKGHTTCFNILDHTDPKRENRSLIARPAGVTNPHGLCNVSVACS